jgi:hypothetical protein
LQRLHFAGGLNRLTQKQPSGFNRWAVVRSMEVVMASYLCPYHHRRRSADLLDFSIVRAVVSLAA